MRYLLLIYANADRWEHPLFLRDPAFLALPPAERDTLIAQAEALREEITASGELVEGVALGDPATARTLRGHAGMPVAGDGPFAEAKEQLAGYFVLDCETPERALQIAARFPDARLTGVELRPVMRGHIEADLSTTVETPLRELAPRVLAALVRRHGHFEAAEDATQEALLAAATQWPRSGVPDDPLAWLITVGSRRLVDELRETGARERRERATAALPPARPPHASARDGDDTLILLVLCCHPELSTHSQVALTLRAVGGLDTAAIARAFLVPEATMAQRISRAKRRLRGEHFLPPPPEELPERLRSVEHVLYLIFTEGSTTSVGDALDRPDLTQEAIRLTRLLHAIRPGDAEVASLLALMLLTDARRAARTTTGGDLVPLAEQDRGRWDAEQIAEGVALVETALGSAPPGPYVLQAAIAAVHAEAPRADATDWPQIASLYRMLDAVSRGPMVTLNRAVAEAMAAGPEAGLALLEPLARDGGLARHHRLHAVRGHLLERLGDRDAARAAYREAARLTTSLPEERYLRAQASRL